MRLIDDDSEISPLAKFHEWNPSLQNLQSDNA
jgi:hypothetical protein